MPVRCAFVLLLRLTCMRARCAVGQIGGLAGLSPFGGVGLGGGILGGGLAGPIGRRLSIIGGYGGGAPARLLP